MTQMDELWNAFKQHEPSARLSGILARKPGYHNSRDHLPSTDYSIRQFTIDREGDKTIGCAIDITFPDAQKGDYTTIAKYSKRLMKAGVDQDPRTKYMREFFGNTDDDKQVEGFDFTKDQYSTSDSSHLWHIHISIHRKYANDPAMVKAVMSILKGESLADYYAQGAKMENVGMGRTKPLVVPPPKKPVAPKFSGKHFVKEFKPLYYPDLARWQARMKQRGWNIDADGRFGPKTFEVVKAFQREKKLTVDGIIGPKTWAAAWTAPITKS